MAFACALEEALVGHDSSCTHAGVGRWDYLTQVRASSSQFKWHKALHQMLDEPVTLLGLQEMDVGVCKVILAEELERGL
jgi:hypothetical protein